MIVSLDFDILDALSIMEKLPDTSCQSFSGRQRSRSGWVRDLDCAGAKFLWYRPQGRTTMKRFIVLMLPAFLVSTVMAEDQPETVFPQQLSAETLMSYCASSSITSRGRQRQRYCAGFVSGVEESLRLLRIRSSQDPNLSLCVPENATARQFQEAFVRYAGRSSTERNQPAVLVAVEALQTAFPCKVD